MFRKSLFGGFREDDVLEYIREIHQKLAVAEQESKTKDARFSELKIRADTYAEDNLRQAGIIAELSRDKEDYKRLKAAEQEMQRLKNEYENALHTAKKLIETARLDAGEIIGAARLRADEIERELRRASREFCSILDSLNERIEAFRARTDSLSRRDPGATDATARVLPGPAPQPEHTPVSKAAPAPASGLVPVSEAAPTGGPAVIPPAAPHERPAEPFAAPPAAHSAPYAPAPEPLNVSGPAAPEHPEPYAAHPEPLDPPVPASPYAQQPYPPATPPAAAPPEPLDIPGPAATEDPPEPSADAPSGGEDEKREDAYASPFGDSFKALEAALANDEELMKLIANLRAFGADREEN